MLAVPSKPHGRRPSIAETTIMKSSNISNADNLDEKALQDKIKNLNKITKDRKAAKKISRNKETISNLMESLRNRPKFTKMVEYSIQCLQNLAVDEGCVEEMIEEGVLDALKSVCTLNPFNEKIMQTVNKTICTFAKNDELKAVIGSKLSTNDFNFSLKKHYEPETLASTCQAITTLCTVPVNMARFVNDGTVAALTSCIKSHAHQADVVGAAAEALSSFAVKPECVQEIVQAGVAEHVLTSIKCNRENAFLVQHAVSFVSQVCQASKQATIDVKKLGGLEILTTAVEVHNEDLDILKATAGALQAISDKDDVGTILELSTESSVSTAAAISKMSSLLLVSDNVEFLTQNDGVNWLMKVMDSATEQDTDIARSILVNGARSVSRLATDPHRIYAIMQAGGVAQLIAAAAKHRSDDAVTVEVIKTFSKLISRKEDAQYICGTGAVKCSVAATHASPNSAKVAKAHLELVQAVAQHENCIPMLLQDNVAEETVDLLMRHIDNVEIASSCVATLKTFAGNNNYIKLLVESGAVDAVVSTLTSHIENAQVAQAAVEFLSVTASTPETVEIMRKLGSYDTILKALEVHAGNAELQSIGARLLGKLAVQTEFTESVTSTLALNRVLLTSGAEDSVIEKLAANVRDLNNLALLEQNAVGLVEAGAVPCILETIENLAKTPVTAVTAGVLTTSTNVLVKLCNDQPQLESIVRQGAVSKLLKLASSVDNGAFAEAVTQLTTACANVPELVAELLEDGAAESIIAVVKANPLDDKVLAMSVKALTLLAADEASVSTLVRAGAAEVVVESALSHMDNVPELTAAVGLLVTLAADERGVSSLVNAGAVDIVLDSMRAHMNKPDLLKICLNGLCSILTSEDVAQQVRDKGGLPLMIKSMREHYRDEGVCELSMVLLDSLASVPDIAEKMLEPELGVMGIIQWAKETFGGNAQINDSANKLLVTLQAVVEEKAKKEVVVVPTEEQIHLTEVKVDNYFQELKKSANKTAVVKQIGALVQDSSNAKTMLGKGGLSVLADLLNDGGDDELFYTTSNAFLSLADHCGDEAAPAIENSRVLQAMCSMMKASESRKTPMDMEDLTKTIGTLAKMKLKPTVVKDLVNHDAVTSLLTIFVKSDDGQLLAQASRLLGKMSNDDDAAEVLAKSANLADLISAIRRNLAHQDFLRYSVYLMGNLASNDTLKDQVGMLGGIQLIVAIMEKYADNQDLVENCAFALNSLSYESPVNSGFIVSSNGAEALIAAVRKHTKAEELLESAVNTLCNICYNNDNYKEVIAQCDGVRAIVEIIRNNFNSVELLMVCYRTMGNMAYNKPMIQAIVRAGAIQGIVAGMTVHGENLKIVDVGICVIANLAVELDEETMNVMNEEGAVRAIIEAALRYTDNMSIEIAALSCLCNLARDSNSNLIVKQGGLKAVIEALTKLDFDPELVDKSVRLLLALSINSENAQGLVDAKVPSLLIAAIKKHIKNKVVVNGSLNALANISCNDAAAAAVAESGAISLSLLVLRDEGKEPIIAADCFKVLSAVSRNEKNAISMADTCLKALIHTLFEHRLQARVMQACCSFLGNLCVHSGASDIVPNTETLKYFKPAVLTHKAEPSVMVRALRALENMAFGSKEVREHMKREGVIELIQQIEAVNSGKEDVRRGCQAALFALNRVENTPQYVPVRNIRSAKAIFGADDNKEEIIELPQAIRNFLLAGSLLTKHSNSAAPRVRHVYITDDLKYLVWKDPKKPVTPQNKMKVFKIRTIERGRCTTQLQRKRMMGGHLAKEETSFAVMGRDRSVDLEAATEADRDRWVTSLDHLVKFVRQQKLNNTKFVQN